MTRKEIGHIELQWTCPNCNSLNPGSQRHCGNCGAPQPKDVEFEQPDRQELITDEQKIKQAEAGPDIHCPYCGSRNPATAEICHKCGGDLIQGVTRESGRVIGAYKTGPVTQINCPHCGAENPDNAKNCSQCGGSLVGDAEIPKSAAVARSTSRTRLWIIGGVIAALVLACSLYFLFANRTSAKTGIVDEVGWQRSVPIEAFIPVEYKDWEDQIPAGGVAVSCSDELRSIQDEPGMNSVEVCGTPYTVDSGSGFAEVVQDCQYEIYDIFCTYTIEEWTLVDTAVLSGSDYSPVWPDPELDNGQRLGESRDESYSIVFTSGDESYVFSTSDFNLFQRAQVGSEWTLNINSFGNLVSIEN